MAITLNDRFRVGISKETTKRRQCLSLTHFAVCMSEIPRPAGEDAGLRDDVGGMQSARLSDWASKEMRRLVVFSAYLYSVARGTPPTPQFMNLKFFSCSLGMSMLLWAAAAFSQSASPDAAATTHGPQYSTQGSVASAASPPQGAPVSYASVTQLNGLLAQLEAASKATQDDLAKLRIERWKTDGSSKKQALGNVDSIQRNLQNALPEMIGQLRNSPEDVPATFKLYRNLDALYDVLGGVVESAGAFGPKDDFQALANDLSNFEGTRKQLAERMENLATSKEQEIVRLRTDLKAAQAAIPAPPPKITVVDDNAPAKKPVPKKKPVAKKPASTTPPATTPGQTPPAQTKPQ
jgi:hypothetical protein